MSLVVKFRVLNDREEKIENEHQQLPDYDKLIIQYSYEDDSYKHFSHVINMESFPHSQSNEHCENLYNYIARKVFCIIRQKFINCSNKDKKTIQGK